MTAPTRADRPQSLRQSSLANFDRCALSAKFAREFERDWSTEPQSRGTLFHRYAALVLRHLHERQEHALAVDLATVLLTETLRQRGVDDRCGICGAAAAFDADHGPVGRVVCEAGHEHGSSFINVNHEQLKDLRWVARKFARDMTFDIENLVDIEQRLLAEVPAPDLGEHASRTLTGQLDALFIAGDQADHAIVLDWKDSWAIPAPTEVGFDGYFQQRFYAFLIFANYGTVQRVTLREVYVRFNDVREADVWRHELPELVGELSALAERYDAAFAERNFPPTPGRHCTMCPIPQVCPIFPKVRGQGAISSPEEAHRAAQELVVAKAVKKRHEESLKAWTSVRGPVEISSHKGKAAVGYVERERTARPTKEQMEAALAAANATRTRPDIDSLYRTAKQSVFTEHQPAEIEPDDADAGLEEALEASLRDAEARRRA